MRLFFFSKLAQRYTKTNFFLPFPLPLGRTFLAAAFRRHHGQETQARFVGVGEGRCMCVRFSCNLCKGAAWHRASYLSCDTGVGSEQTERGEQNLTPHRYVLVRPLPPLALSRGEQLPLPSQHLQHKHYRAPLMKAHIKLRSTSSRMSSLRTGSA